jgi:hypothetical protein
MLAFCIAIMVSLSVLLSPAQNFYRPRLAVPAPPCPNDFSTSVIHLRLALQLVRAILLPPPQRAFAPTS